MLGGGRLAEQMREMIAADPDRYRPETWSMDPVGGCPCCGQDVYRCTTRHTEWREGFASHHNVVHPSFNAGTHEPDPGGTVVGCCCVAPNWGPMHRDDLVEMTDATPIAPRPKRKKRKVRR